MLKARKCRHIFFFPSNSLSSRRVAATGNIIICRLRCGKEIGPLYSTRCNTHQDPKHSLQVLIYILLKKGIFQQNGEEMHFYK